MRTRRVKVSCVVQPGPNERTPRVRPIHPFVHRSGGSRSRSVVRSRRFRGVPIVNLFPRHARIDPGRRTANGDRFFTTTSPASYRTPTRPRHDSPRPTRRGRDRLRRPRFRTGAGRYPTAIAADDGRRARRCATDRLRLVASPLSRLRNRPGNAPRTSRRPLG